MLSRAKKIEYVRYVSSSLAVNYLDRAELFFSFVTFHQLISLYLFTFIYKKAELSQRWPRDAHYIWVPWKFSGVPDYAYGYFTRDL